MHCILIIFIPNSLLTPTKSIPTSSLPNIMHIFGKINNPSPPFDVVHVLLNIELFTGAKLLKKTN